MAKQFFNEEYMLSHCEEKLTHHLRFVDLEGKTFGKLTAHGYTKYKGQSAWWCSCVCSQDRYFIVPASSLKAGATTSCGCNYKKNGGNTPETLDEFQSKVGKAWKIHSYKGRNHVCVAECTSCGDRSVKKANSFISGVTCPCRNERISRRDKYLAMAGYTLLEETTGVTNNIFTFSCVCSICGTPKKILSSELITLEACPCTIIKQDGVSPETASAVYLLVHKVGGYCKIGKAISPTKRVLEINKSGGDFELVKCWWASSQYHSYVLERALHVMFSDYRFIGGEFSGSTECFDITPEFALQKISTLEIFNEPYITSGDIEALRPKEDLIIKNPYSKCGFIVESRDYHFNESGVCLWIPSKAYFGKGKPFSSAERAEECDYLIENKELVRKRNREKSVEKFMTYEVDGVFDSMRGWSRKTGINDATLSWRVFNMGMSMKDAINYKKPDQFILCNGEMVKKRDLNEIIGVSWTSVYKMSKYHNISPEEVIATRFAK